ncbi:MAG: EAL domain-containing protein [Treponema sp.]|uniref:EAL domain-containing protein n=1 Tax=Treponema sp. TaxID=166 RepID=UPI00298DF610|nr:EAL domain-containing protein [Treponema sp.]MBR5934264.1 EAL domain-containing protein [Treponema sp.]
MRIGEKVKQFLGIGRYSPSVEQYFELSNVRSSIYLSIVIVSLELWMILSAVIRQLTGASIRSTQWLVNHLSAYFILLVAGLIMLVYALLYLKDKKRVKKAGAFIYILFSLVSLVFGIYISYLDYVKGEQFITLITMTIFVFCFIVWRPVYTISFLTVAFVFFLYVCHTAIPASYATKVNLFIIWIALLMASISSYHQKIKEAKKDERLIASNNLLIKLSISDEVTGISNMTYFRAQTLNQMRDPGINIKKKIFLFLDIEHFKYYNDKYGFFEGNNFLRKFAEILVSTFSNAVVAHFSNDNFVVFTDNEDVEEKLEVLRRFVQNPDYEIKMSLKVGGYRPEDRECLPVVACDHARYACYSIKKLYDRDYCEYDAKMAKDFYKNQYIINNIDTAIHHNYIKIYYQPVIDSKNGLLCGAEALARWDDPKYGFLSPADFIQVLEEYHQIHKLDMYVVRKVCEDIAEQKKDGRKIIPVSLNFSRLDFEYVDLAQEVEKNLVEFGIDKKHIHVEITESALSENNERLQTSLRDLRNSGHSLWLDDFGSGYSGLNVLKEYDFDMMKIDMKFLSNFGRNEKAKTLLKSIVTLAKELGMQTLSEGVETDEAKEFLTSIGCERMQGYLFGRPMPKNEFFEKIQGGVYKI